MFANAGVPWPEEVMKLFDLLSAFNLNIQLVAPECLVPSVSFSQKFAFIVMLPGMRGVLDFCIYCEIVVWKSCV